MTLPRMTTERVFCWIRVRNEERSEHPLSFSHHQPVFFPCLSLPVEEQFTGSGVGFEAAVGRSKTQL